MLNYLFCLLTVITLVFTKEVHVPKNGSRPVKAIRIAGGEEVEEGHRGFEHQVQMFINKGEFCSGAILSKWYIVTAAHCVQDVDDLVVRAGSVILGEGTIIPILEIHIHPNYNEPENNFDVAYMKTETRIPLGDKIRVAYLAPELGEQQQVVISGWGSDGFHGDKLSDVLMYVELPVINNMECQIFYPEVGITKNMVCAQRTGEFTKGTCLGDGGGPATVINTRRLYGISSFTRGCGPGMGPSVFTYLGSKDIRDFIINGTKVDYPYSSG